MSRDVRTLLFCRLTPNEKRVNGTVSPITDTYAELAKEKNDQPNKHTLFAFGGYSALCVYQTPEVEGDRWLEAVYADKQRIIAQTKPNINYHQMHLVSQEPSSVTFWDCKDNEYPFFFATLVYGAKGQKPEEELSDNECSAYEHIIRQHIQEKNTDSTRIRYSIYNGIGISDVVILWRANDYLEVSRLIASIESEGVARKTITTFGLPIGADGTVKSCVFDQFRKNKDEPITVCVHGNIRNMQLFKTVEKELTEALGGECPSEDEKNDYLNWTLGKYDFTLSVKSKFENIENLIRIYETHESIISEACWEIYTDLHVPHPHRSDNRLTVPSHSPTPILNDVYNDFRICYQSTSIQNYSWANTMMELMSTHYFIDRHPILHGPSYLVYHSLRIVNAYLSRGVMDYADEDKHKQLLIRSEESLKYFVRSWDQLTEQITRNDDAILNNRSNTHTIHLSLPESALDFYHAFIRLIVSFVVAYDNEEGRIPDDFEFDFLLSPQNASRFRFRKVFQTSHEEQADRSPGKIWPQKQVYILDLPLKSVFSPLDFFIPAVHECFHCFGDRLRNRSSRLKHMIGFMAITMATAINCGTLNYRSLVRRIAQKIQMEVGLIESGEEPYLTHVQKLFRVIMPQMFSLGQLDSLFLELGGKAYYLYSDHVLNTCVKAFERYQTPSHLRSANCNTPMIVSLVESCVHYFKECYADAMTIALLKLTPSEYLERMSEELERLYQNPKYNKPINVSQDTDAYIVNNANSLAQRNSAVLAACCGVAPLAPGLENKISSACKIFTVKECLESISKLEKTYPEYAQSLRGNFESLVNPACQMPNYPSSIPPAALHHVVEYLIESINMMICNPTVLPLCDGIMYDLDKLRKDFEEIIRQGDMFGKRFYQIIYYHHQDTKNGVQNPDSD